jgi:SAM-dependent methyltransferase
MSATRPLSADQIFGPSPWIERWAHLVRTGARVLDVAAGEGRHARFFAGRGGHVTAIDRDRDSLAVVAGVPGIETRVVDVETAPWPFDRATFDAIVVVRYLHRPLLPHLLASLAGDGVFLYETFAVGNEAFGRPTNPDFLLRPDELLEAVRGHLSVIAFEQGRIDGERPAVVQRLAAVGPRAAWPSRLSP